MESIKCKTRKPEVRFFCSLSSVLCLLFSVLALCGCSSIVSPYVISRRQELPYDASLSDVYYKTELKKSGALDVLPVIHKPESELLSQSRSVVASLGQGKDGYKVWFNMVAFDEARLTAKRKYFFLVDEQVKRLLRRPRRFLMEPKRGLMFDSQMVLEKSAVDKPSISEKARQITRLKQVLRNLHEDVNKLGKSADASRSDKMLTTSAMLMNQIFGTILHTLDRSPALAGMLSDSGGVEFDHINFGKGKIRMVIEDNIAVVKIRVGVFVGTFENKDRRLTPEEKVESIDSAKNTPR